MATTQPTPIPDAVDPRTARAPQQERGQRRVEQILDAAESVFAELGVEIHEARHHKESRHIHSLARLGGRNDRLHQGDLSFR